jgi:hypothetical protein
MMPHNYSNAESEDHFGVAVALSNQTLVVTAPGEDSSTDEGEADNSALSSGAAYIWKQSIFGEIQMTEKAY